MTIFWVILVGLLTFLTLGGPLLFIHSRKVLREQKNFERGLKMVPLLIHLPPISDDTEVAGRDVRDLVDENISKAQILYGIIASTLQKGLKSKFYGQRHVSFEIIGSQGFVNFYVAVPVVLIDVVKQAIVSAYPAARLEEVAEHNIFSPIGKLTGTVGGELTLKEHFAYPIATFQELKRDAMQSILNAMSTLGKDDGIGIQILLRPASSKWRKEATAVASKKRKGKEDKKGGGQAFMLGREVLTAFVKPPEAKEGDKGGPGKDLSTLDQSIVEAIEDKTRHPAYEVLIRIVASSNINQKAQAALNNVVATFSLFDAGGKNGFKYIPAKDIERFVTSYVLRFFPPENNKSILNSVELATIFHFPDQRNIPTSQLERQDSKQVDGPRNVPETGMLLGYNLFRGVKKPIRLDQEDRRRHVYAVGQTGTGKSTFLENMALQDMLNGNGFAFVDPHGDTAERLLSMVPRERTEDVVYFSPADMDYPMGLNLFEAELPQQKDFLIQEAINMLYKLYDPQHQGIIGPRYEHWFRNIALTVMAQPDGGTFIDIPTILNNYKNKAYLNEKLSHITDQTVKDFWYGEMAQTSDYHISEVLGWFVSKFGAFRSNEMMRNIIGQVKSAFDLREIMDNKKILLVNLSKGRTGELNSKLLGMIFVMKFQAAAMSRATIPEEERQDFCLYVDEFQNFSTDSFATIMSEARKYRLNLIVANQFTTQLTEEIRDAVFGNMGTIVSYRVGTNDVEALTKYFSPVFDADDLLRVPNFNAIVRTMIGGVPTQPFSMAGLPPLGTPNKKLGDALKQLSSAKYGRPKAVVEAEIFERLKTKDVTRPTTMPASPAAFATPGAMKPPAQPGAGASFLDEWLNKRRLNSPTASASQTPGVPSYKSPAIPPQMPLPTSDQPIFNPSAPTRGSVTLPTIGAPLNPPQPLPISPKKTTTTHPAGELDLSKKFDTSGDNAQPDDTIYIDREGNIKDQ